MLEVLYIALVYNRAASALQNLQTEIGEIVHSIVLYQPLFCAAQEITMKYRNRDT